MYFILSFQTMKNVIYIVTQLDQMILSMNLHHSLHLQGDQRSPGIIPLAVKDAFSIIQEVITRKLSIWFKYIIFKEMLCLMSFYIQTPNREFLLRVSYLEIYNEVCSFPFIYFQFLMLGFFVTSFANFSKLLDF